MSGPLDRARSAAQEATKPEPEAETSATGWGSSQSKRIPPAPVGSDAPNRWLTSAPPGEIDALRSSSPRRLGRHSRLVKLIALLSAVVLLGALALWQTGVLDSLLGSDPADGPVTAPPTTLAFAERPLVDQIDAALVAAGFSDLLVVVDGDRATVSGVVADEASVNAAALAVLDVPGVAQLDNRLEIGTVVPTTAVLDALTAALAADEHAYVSFEVLGNLAVLEGQVPSEAARNAAATAALGVAGIDKVDNRLTIDANLPIGPALPPEQLEAAAATALSNVGIQTVAVSVEGRRALLDGTVPLEELGSGFFAFVEKAESAVLSVEGIDQVSSRLTLRGDGAILRNELQTLLAANPVEFELGSSELTAASRAVLDQAALIIQSQPGLQIIIAGHTDTAGSNETNQALATDRAEAVLNYLLTRGVPPYRLIALSYGELFPDQEATDEQNRRVEFEVGP